MNLQWYPGHMTKAKRSMQEDLKLIDVVIELLDARIPLSSRNPDIDQLAKQKSRVILLNKCDLASDAGNQKWAAWFEEQGYVTALVNSKSGKGIKAVDAAVKKACAAKLERDRKRGILNRPVRAMIAGIPNVGKSTFINSFAGKACAKTGNRPGVTKGKQWIRLNRSVELLDTPGILWPKFEDQTVGLHLAWIGSIRDEILNAQELSLELIAFLMEKEEGALERYYQIGPCRDKVELLTSVAVKRGCLKKEQELDYDKAAKLLLDDFKSAKIGKFTLEFPESH